MLEYLWEKYYFIQIYRKKTLTFQTHFFLWSYFILRSLHLKMITFTSLFRLIWITHCWLLCRSILLEGRGRRPVRKWPRSYKLCPTKAAPNGWAALEPRWGCPQRGWGNNNKFSPFCLFDEIFFSLESHIT